MDDSMIDNTGSVVDKNTVPLSVLDLSPIAQGKTARDAFHASLDLAQHAENGDISATGSLNITI